MKRKCEECGVLTDEEPVAFFMVMSRIVYATSAGKDSIKNGDKSKWNTNYFVKCIDEVKFKEDDMYIRLTLEDKYEPDKPVCFNINYIIACVGTEDHTQICIRDDFFVVTEPFDEVMRKIDSVKLLQSEKNSES